jgi:hypothetical protein
MIEFLPIQPGGRPTDYREEYCGLIVEFCQKRGISAFASAIGVSRSTLKKWVHEHPEFSAAVEIAKTSCAARWEDRLEKIGDEGRGATTATMFALTNYAPDDFKQKQTVENTGAIPVAVLTPDDVGG